MGLACCKDSPTPTQPLKRKSSSLSARKNPPTAQVAPIQAQPTASTSLEVDEAKNVDHHQKQSSLKDEIDHQPGKSPKIEESEPPKPENQEAEHSKEQPKKEENQGIKPSEVHVEEAQPQERNPQEDKPEKEEPQESKTQVEATEETNAKSTKEEKNICSDSCSEKEPSLSSHQSTPSESHEESQVLEPELTEETNQNSLAENKDPKESEDDVPPPLPTSPPPDDDELTPPASDRKMVDAEVLEKLEAGYKKLEAATDCKSLLKKYLTKEVFDELKTKKTALGATLLDVIQSGVENLDSGVGIYAPDAEAYTLFAPLFDPIIEDYHVGFKQSDKHPGKDFGDLEKFVNVDPEGTFVVSTRVRCGRSMEGYPFNPCLTEDQYKEMEEKVSSTLSSLEDELKGTYYPLTGMSKDVQQKLIDDHFLFKEGDRFLQAANACRYWPTGRGIYHNDKKTFLVWANEEDHLRIISMQKGGDLGEIYSRLVKAVGEIEKRVPFSHHDRLGFLTFCPTNLGTTIRASVHIKLPKLAANKTKLEEVAAKYNLQVRGTRGEHTEAEGGIYDISNKRRMGLTEFQAVKEMQDGILELIKIEKEM